MKGLFRQWRTQRRELSKLDIFDPKFEDLREAADKTLLELLTRPIQDKADVGTLLAVIYACGTFERPIRRALLNLMRFLGAH